MKLNEMADLLSGLTDTFERCLKSSEAKDLRTVSELFRSFGDAGVSTLAEAIEKARNGNGVRPKAAKAPAVAPAALLAEIREFLANRDKYDFGQLQGLASQLHKLKKDELVALATELKIAAGKSNKGEIANKIASWLSDLKLSDAQSNFTFEAPPPVSRLAV